MMQADLVNGREPSIVPGCGGMNEGIAMVMLMEGSLLCFEAAMFLFISVRVFTTGGILAFLILVCGLIAIAKLNRVRVGRGKASDLTFYIVWKSSLLTVQTIGQFSK